MTGVGCAYCGGRGEVHDGGDGMPMMTVPCPKCTVPSPLELEARRILNAVAHAKGTECSSTTPGGVCLWCVSCEAAKIKVVTDALQAERDRAGLLIDCDKCHGRLKVQGGVLFGPPGESGHPVKLHVCVECWDAVLDALLAKVDKLG